jgi:hypothetical protein
MELIVMPKKEKLIILVHGMGTHSVGDMKKEFVGALTERAKDFSLDLKEKLESVDYLEFNYSEYFDVIRKQFADNAAAQKKGFSYLAGRGFEASLLSQLNNFESKLGKDDFFYTHWLDVILYSTMYFGEKLRVDFINLLEKSMNKYGHSNIHIVCHSLGTALVYDSLAKYFRLDANPFDSIKDKKAGEFNLNSIWAFANVSRMVNILNGLADPLYSTVTIGNKGCTSIQFNIVNKYDPFTWFKTYDRQQSEIITIEDSRSINTHDFYEYIAEPKVAREILNWIYDIQIDENSFNAGAVAYNKGLFGDQLKNIKETIDKARKDHSIQSIKDAIRAFKDIFSAMETNANIGE